MVCEYNPPGNIDGEYAYVFHSHSVKSANLRDFFFHSAKTSKPKTEVFAFCFAYTIDTNLAGERISLDTPVVFGWTPVDTPLCELVASGMSSQCVGWNASIFLPMIARVRLGEVGPGGDKRTDHNWSIHPQ